MTTTITGATGVNQITDDAITVAKLPAGSVLQVVSAIDSTSTVSTSGTYADTGLTATITPSSTTSKILISLNTASCLSTVNASGISLKLTRGSQQLIEFEKYMGYNSAGISVSSSVCFLDSPNTTSSTIYKLMFKRTSGSATVYVGDNSSEGTITLTEIQG